MKTVVYSILSIVFAVTAYANSEPILSVTLERTMCFGTCPDYSVTIHSNGEVVYEGKYHVKKKGPKKGKIRKDEFERLVDKIGEMDFWSLQDSYSRDVKDHPSYYVTVRTNTKEKRIRRYAVDHAELEELEDLIDEIAKTKKWIGRNK